MRARNKKILTIFAVGFLILSSVGVAAQDTELSYNPDSTPENRTATQEFQYIHSIDGGEINPNQSSGTEEIIGFEINQDRLNYLAYGEGASGNNLYRLEMKTLNLNTHQSISRYASTFADYTDPDIGPSAGEFTMYNSTSSTRRIYPYSQRTAFSVENNGEKFISDCSGDGSSDCAELYSSKEESLSSFEVLDGDSSYNTIPFVTSSNVNGTTKILYIVDDGGTNRKVISYDNESGTAKEIYNLWGFSAEFGSYHSFSPTENDILTYRNNINRSLFGDTSGATLYHNYSTGNTSFAYFNIIANSNNLVAVNPEYINDYNDSFYIFQKERLATMLETTPNLYNYADNNNQLARSYSSIAFSSPIENRHFSRGFYQSGYWFFGNKKTNKFYVYSDDPFQHEYTISNAWTDVPEEENYKFTGYEAKDGSIHIATTYDNTLTIYDSTINVKESCMQYQLQEFWISPNVCWLPIFVGQNPLSSIYQWLMLAILISMPIAKETRSEIATMATIDGVLLIGMLIGTISAGFVAVAILATILLSVYGMSGTDVEINNMGGGGI